MAYEITRVYQDMVANDQDQTMLFQDQSVPPRFIIVSSEVPNDEIEAQMTARGPYTRDEAEGMLFFDADPPFERGNYTASIAVTRANFNQSVPDKTIPLHVAELLGRGLCVQVLALADVMGREY